MSTERTVFGGEVSFSEPQVLEDMLNVHVKVTMTYIQDLARIHTLNIDQAYIKPVFTGSKEQFQSELERFIYTGFYYRIEYALQTGNKYTKFVGKAQQFKTLVSLSQLWSYIGKAVYVDKKVRFIPTVDDPDPTMMMTQSEYLEFQNELTRFSKYLVLSWFPREIDGDPEFMSLIWYKERLKTYYENVASLAFASSIVEKTSDNPIYEHLARRTFATKDEVSMNLDLSTLSRIFLGANQS